MVCNKMKKSKENSFYTPSTFCSAMGRSNKGTRELKSNLCMNPTAAAVVEIVGGLPTSTIKKTY